MKESVKQHLTIVLPAGILLLISFYFLHNPSINAADRFSAYFCGGVGILGLIVDGILIYVDRRRKRRQAVPRRVEEMKKLPAAQLIAVAQKALKADVPWLLLQSGTVLMLPDGVENTSEARTEVWERWCTYGAGMDDGCSYLLKDDSGWVVTCGGFRNAETLVLKDELEPNCHPLKATIAGFQKRSDDHKNPVVIHANNWEPLPEALRADTTEVMPIKDQPDKVALWIPLI